MSEKISDIFFQVEELHKKVDRLLMRNQFEVMMQDVADKHKLGKRLIEAIILLQDDLTEQEPETHANEKGEKFRSPFVHAESLKSVIIDIFGLEDGR